MKIQFEEKDITAGMYVVRASWNMEMNRAGYGRTVVFKIIFDNGHPYEKQYGSCNCLTDGWVRNIGSKQDVCDWLNKEDEDGYRLLTKQEYIYLVSDEKYTLNFASL